MSETVSVFASAGDDIKLWDANSLEIIKQYNFHKGNVKDLCWSSDNSILCSTSASGDKIILCDCYHKLKEKPKVIAECAAGEHQTCVQLALSGRKIYSGGVAGDVNVWDQQSGKLKKSYKDSHSSPITCVALNDLETYIATGTNKGDIVIRNLSSDATMKPELGVKGQAVRSMVFSPWKHSLLGMALDDGSLCLWDSLHSTSYHNFLQVHKAPAMSLAFSPFNDLLFASVGLDKHLIVYDVKGHKILNKTVVDQPLTSLTFMHDGVSLFAGSSLGRVYQFDLRSIKRAVKDVPGHTTSVQKITAQNAIKVKKERKKKSEIRNSNHAGFDERNSGHVSATPTDDSWSQLSDLSTAPVPTGGVSVRLAGGDRLGRGDSEKNAAAGVSATRSRIDGMGDGEFFFANGHQDTTNLAVGSKSYDNSTPSVSTRVQSHHVDDLGGILSPVQNDAPFGSYSLASHDGSLGAVSQLPPLGGNTFSSSRDTIGSYTDDILSPIADPGKPPKARTPHAGLQLHTRTSPHPLRVSNNLTTVDAPKDSVPKTTEKSAPKPQVTPNRNITSRTASTAARTADKLLSTLAPPASAVSSNAVPGSSATSGTPTMHLTNSSRIQPGPSIAVASGNGGDVTAFQYQAEYLRNTVKELVDEMGDDIRQHTNDALTQIVKLFLYQEELIRELLLQRKCDVNEQLLQEVERLREENDRLRRKF